MNAVAVFSPSQEDIRDKLSAISGMEGVGYKSDSSDYNKDNHTLYVLEFSCGYDSAEEQAIEAALDSDFSCCKMIWKSDNSSLSAIPVHILIVIMIILMTILFVMCGSCIEPFLFLLTIGIAVMLNSGTNLIMGSVAIFVTKGDTGTVFISPRNEDGTPYYLSHGERVRLFIRLIPDRPPVVQKELHKEEQNEDGSFCVYFSSSDTDLPRASYMYEAKLYNTEKIEICTFIGGGKYKPRFIVGLNNVVQTVQKSTYGMN